MEVPAIVALFPMVTERLINTVAESDNVMAQTVSEQTEPGHDDKQDREAIGVLSNKSTMYNIVVDWYCLYSWYRQSNGKI